MTVEHESRPRPSITVELCGPKAQCMACESTDLGACIRVLNQHARKGRGSVFVLCQDCSKRIGKVAS